MAGSMQKTWHEWWYEWWWWNETPRQHRKEQEKNRDALDPLGIYHDRSLLDHLIQVAPHISYGDELHI